MEVCFFSLEDQETVADEWIRHNQISAETYRSLFAPHIESALHQQFDSAVHDIPDYAALIPNIVKQLRYLPPSSAVLVFHQNRIASRQIIPTVEFIPDLPPSFTPAFQQMHLTTQEEMAEQQQTQHQPQFPANEIQPMQGEQSPVQTPRWFCGFPC